MKRKNSKWRRRSEELYYSDKHVHVPVLAHVFFSKKGKFGAAFNRRQKKARRDCCDFIPGLQTSRGQFLEKMNPRQFDRCQKEREGGGETVEERGRGEEEL